MYSVRKNSFLGSYSARFLIILTCFLAVGQSNAQTGDDALRFAQRMPGLTASSMGMGGVGISGVTDASAFFNNPAGLGWATSSNVSGSLSALSTLDDGVFVAPSSMSQFKNDVTAAGIGSVSYLFKVPTTRGSMVVGAGFNQVSTFSRSLVFSGENNANSLTDYLMPVSGEFELQEDDDGVFPLFDRTLSFIGFETYAIDLDAVAVQNGDANPFVPAVNAGTVRQAGYVDESGRMMEVNIGGAMEVAKDVMVGLTVSAPYGTYSFARELTENDFLNDNDGTNGTTDFKELQFNEQVESEIVGVNLRLGVSAKVNASTKVGLTIETPTWYAVEDVYSTKLATRFDNGDAFQYGGDSDDAGTGTFDYSFVTPWKVGMGAEYAVAGAKISADVEWIDWSQMELDSDGYSFFDENFDITRGLETVTNVRIGASYDVGKTTLRGGLAMYPDPHNETSSNTSLDTDRVYVSAGATYKLADNMKIDFGWMAEAFEDEYAVYNEVNDAPIVTEDIIRSRVQIGFTFGF